MPWACQMTSPRTWFVSRSNMIFSGLRANKSSQGAYIYQPSKHGKSAGERPSKRRKVSSTAERDEQFDRQRFVPLLNGDENAESVQLRHDTYRELWSKQENKIQVSQGKLMGGHSDTLLTRPEGYPRGCGCWGFDGCVVLCPRHLTSDVRPYSDPIHEHALTRTLDVMDVFLRL